MKRLTHLLPLCVQALILWVVLRAVPVYAGYEEKAFIALLYGKPLPGLSRLLLDFSHIQQAMPYEWRFISLLASATYLFAGFMVLFSTTDLQTAIQRSYVYQITCTVTLALVTALAFIAALLPFVVILQDMETYVPKLLTAKEILWNALTWAYLLLLGLLAGWRLLVLHKTSKDRPE